MPDDVHDVGDVIQYLYGLYADAHSFSCLLGKFLNGKH